MKKNVFPFSIMLVLFCVFGASSAFADFDYKRYIIKETSPERDGVTKEKVAAEDVTIRTPDYRNDHKNFQPRLGTYTYDVSWAGIPAATAEVEVDKDGMAYHISTKVRTARGIDLLYRLRYNADGWVSTADLHPLRSKFLTEENSKVKFAELTFKDNGEIYAIRGKKGKAPEQKTFTTGNLTFDPFSASFVARSMEWEKGQSRVFDTYNGKSRYLIHLSCIDIIETKLNGVMKKIWVISPSVQKINDKAKSKLREARIYVTADEHREILKIESEVFVGTVHTVLSSFQEKSGRSSVAMRQK